MVQLRALGHTRDLNQDIYTVTQFETRKEAGKSLEFSLSQTRVRRY